MDLDNTDAVVEETPIEVTAEPTVTDEVTEDVVEVPTDEPIVEPTSDDVPDEDDPAVPQESVEETPAIIFDANEDWTTLDEKVTPVLGKYELPAEVQAVLDVYKAKAEAPASSLEPYKVYGNEEEIVQLLERQSHLDTSRQTEQGYRPNTDKFVASITDPVVLDHLRRDVLGIPSTKYQGVTAFEELVVDTLANEGETVGQVLNKYDRFIEAFKTNSLPTADLPEFIPENLAEAFYKLSRDERNEIGLLDATDEYDRAKIDAKKATLEFIQKGIEGEKYRAQQENYQRQQAETAFVEAVEITKAKFFNAFREEVAQDLIKNVAFSSDPKLNTFLAHQQMSLLTEALDPAGESARQALEAAGIRFDYAKAQQMIADTDRASVELQVQERNKDAKGNYLDKPAYNRAVQQWQTVGKAFQTFAKDIIEQEARLVSTGTAEAVKKEVAKIKIAPKARLAPQGAGVASGKPSTLNKVPVFGTPEFDDWNRKNVDKIWDAYQQTQAA